MKPQLLKFFTTGRFRREFSTATVGDVFILMLLSSTGLKENEATSAASVKQSRSPMARS